MNHESERIQHHKAEIFSLRLRLRLRLRLLSLDKLLDVGMRYTNALAWCSRFGLATPDVSRTVGLLALELAGRCEYISAFPS